MRSRQNNSPSLSSTQAPQPPIVLSAPSQANQSLTVNNTSQPSTQHDSHANIGKKSHSTSLSVEEALNSFRKVLKGKKVDKIAEQYDERLDPWLKWDEIQFASIAQRLVESHEKAKKSGTYDEFITLYRWQHKNYVISSDIEATISQLSKYKN